VRDLLIDEDAPNNTGTNTDFLTDSGGTPHCAACDGKGSLCVKDSGLEAYAFYSLMAER
jgi:hypothetical protein